MYVLSGISDRAKAGEAPKMACITITAAKTERVNKRRPFNVSGTGIHRLLIRIAPPQTLAGESPGQIIGTVAVRYVGHPAHFSVVAVPGVAKCLGSS